MSGYLLEEKEELNVDYFEKKIKNIIVKLFGWIVFWIAIHFIYTGEMYDLSEQMTAGAGASGGALPVAWFLYTYCILMLFAYPMDKFLRKRPVLVGVVAFIWIIALAAGMGEMITQNKVQTLWLHLYGGYFMLGMVWNRYIRWITKRIKMKWIFFTALIISVLSLIVYMYELKTSVIYLRPDQYYGKWYYTVWLLFLFSAVLCIKVRKECIQKIIRRMAENTFVVYLGHLPILLYVTTITPLKNTGEAMLYIVLFFTGLEGAAEFFRRMPLLRKLV